MAITKQELIEGLKVIADRQKDKRSDIECDHGEADQLLLDYIDDSNVNNLWNDIDMWYA